MTPSLSIVIPVLNEEPRITSALRALAPLTLAAITGALLGAIVR